MIKILIVDDSDTEIAILKYLFENEKDMCVIGIAKNGKEALDLTEKLKPDLITMDIEMPIMDGLAATRLIMSRCPTPIVIISSKAKDKTQKITYDALDEGALSVLDKPIAVVRTQLDKQAHHHMIQTIRSMAEIKVIKRRFYSKKPNEILNQATPLDKVSDNYEIIAIGTSIGGPQVLKMLFKQLPKDFPIPIVIVQHMTPGFIDGFIKCLNDESALTIKKAEDHEPLLPGTVHFAPDGFHLEIKRSQEQLFTQLRKGPPTSGFCPSATVLLRSVAKVCGKNAIGIILTGMGNDGAEGLLELKQAKGHTLIQDEDSAVVFGMPGIAKSIGAVDKVIQIDQAVEYLTRIVKHH